MPNPVFESHKLKIIRYITTLFPMPEGKPIDTPFDLDEHYDHHRENAVKVYDTIYDHIKMHVKDCPDIVCRVNPAVHVMLNSKFADGVELGSKIGAQAAIARMQKLPLIDKVKLLFKGKKRAKENAPTSS